VTLNCLFRLHKVCLLTKNILLSCLCSGNPFIRFDEFHRSVQLYGQLISMDKEAWARFEEAIDILEGAKANQCRSKNVQMRGS
jgi:hypothetical protein